MGNSESESNSTTKNLNTSIGVDGDNLGFLLSNVSGTTIEVSDHNAIDAAFKLAESTLGVINNSQIESYKAINDNLTQSLEFVETQNLPDNGQQSEALKTVALTVGALGAAYFAFKK